MVQTLVEILFLCIDHKGDLNGKEYKAGKRKDTGFILFFNIIVIRIYYTH